MSLVDTDLRDLIAGVLEENRLKAPRVQANILVQLLQSRRPDTDEDDWYDEPEPPRWAKYVERNAPLLEDGIATTRNRTREAMHALGLDPNEVRAVVIEPFTMHVFRWTDTTTRVGIGQPILED